MATKYIVVGRENARLVQIQSRSDIEVVVAKFPSRGFLGGAQADYYISSPNFGVAIPNIPSLQETFWITEKLMHAGMPTPDAVTVAQVLRDMDDF